MMHTAVYERLGYQWATSLLAFLTLAMAPFPYGPQFPYLDLVSRRERSGTNVIAADTYSSSMEKQYAGNLGLHHADRLIGDVIS